MNKIIKALIGLCLITAMVSTASASFPSLKTTFFADSENEQLDQAGVGYVWQHQYGSGSAASISTLWGATPAGVTVSQSQSGYVDEDEAHALQETSVNAQGYDAFAQSSQSSLVHVGTSCTTEGGCIYPCVS